MTRDELLQPGQYASLPKSVLADRRISPGAKLVLMALIDHLGSKNETAWLGPSKLGKETGRLRTPCPQSH